MKTGNIRRFAVFLGLSAVALVALLREEDYREVAYDDGVGVQTLGFGSTTHEDGKPVKPGDRTTVVKALDRTIKDIERFEAAVQRCVTVPLHQHEFDFAVHWAYNIGEQNFCASTLVKKWNEKDYAGGCRTVTLWHYAQGKDCRIRENNCYGLIGRRQREMAACLGE